MKKNVFLAVALLALMAAGAFAQPAFKLSVGGGGLLELGTSGGVDFGYGAKLKMLVPKVAGGGFAFFDATYAEFSLGFWGGSGSASIPGYMNANYSGLGLSLSLLGKYPFELSEKFTLFPLLGIDYHIMLSAKDEDGEKLEPASDLNALWFKLGIGLDYSFTDNIYLRFSTLFGIRTKTQFEEDVIDLMGWGDTILGTGLTARIAVGYRF